MDLEAIACLVKYGPESKEFQKLRNRMSEKEISLVLDVYHNHEYLTRWVNTLKKVYRIED